MRKNKSLISLIGALALIGCDEAPELRKNEDLTGDGIKDILIYNHTSDYQPRGNYLFIGQKDGNFIRTKEIVSEDKRTKYFQADNGDSYFFDGKFYVLSPKDENLEK